MIDPTPTQSLEYSKLIEAEGPSQDEIDYKAIQILRGLSALDISEVMMGVADRIKTSTIDYMRADSESMRLIDESYMAHVVRTALWDYCQRIALRELEA